MDERARNGKSEPRLDWDGKPRLPDPNRARSLFADEIVQSGSHPFPCTMSLPDNRLIAGDNLEVMQALLAEGFADAFSLIYIDPPYCSEGAYHQRLSVGERPAYDDRWQGLDAYLTMLHPRLQLIHRLLSPTGSLYVHLDWRSVHYVKVMLDEIFGRSQFRNEIIWRRAHTLGRKARAEQYGRVTDSILFYSKGSRITFNRIYRTRPASQAGLQWDASRKRYFRTAPRGDYTDASIAELEAEGRIHRTRTGSIRIKYFLEQNSDGEWVERTPIDALWLDLPDLMHLSPAERTGYATQKPEALLERVISVSSSCGDLVGDFFAGSGTTLAVADRLGRRWIGADSSMAAIQTTRCRLTAQGSTPFRIDRFEPLPAASDLDIAPRVCIRSRSSRGASVHVELGAKDIGSIESWAIDWDFDGRIFRGRKQVTRGLGRPGVPLAEAVELEVPLVEPRSIAIRAYSFRGDAATEIASIS